LQLLQKKGKYKPVTLRKEVQDMMWEHAGVLRTERKLKSGLKKLEVLKKKISGMSAPQKMNTREFIAALDVFHMITPCEAILKCALLRKESRGGHARTDYPKQKASWRVNIHCQKVNGKMKLWKVPIKKTPNHLKKYMELKLDVQNHLLE